MSRFSTSIAMHHFGPVRLSDNRDHTSPYVAVKLGGMGDDVGVTMFFASKDELVFWLSEARYLALALPDDEREANR